MLGCQRFDEEIHGPLKSFVGIVRRGNGCACFEADFGRQQVRYEFSGLEYNTAVGFRDVLRHTAFDSVAWPRLGFENEFSSWM